MPRDRRSSVPLKHPPNSVLLLTDCAHARFNRAIVGFVNDCAKANTPYVRFSALTRVNPMQKIVVNALVRLLGRPIRALDNRRQALDWLIDQVEAAEAAEAGINGGVRNA